MRTAHPTGVGSVPTGTTIDAGARIQRTETRAFSVTAHSQCQARHGLGPRGAPTPLAVARYRLLPAGGTNPSVLTHQIFWLNTFKVGATRSLYTSPAHQAYASTRPLPCAPQGSMLGSRLTITQVGFPPTRLRDIAKPHCPPLTSELASFGYRRRELVHHGYRPNAHERSRAQLGYFLGKTQRRQPGNAGSQHA